MWSKYKPYILVGAIALVAVALLSKIIDKMILLPLNYQASSAKAKYYAWLKAAAKKVGAEYGIPYQAILVQTGLETGWGKSSLLLKDNNFGGVKYAGSGAPNKVNYPTKEFQGGGYVTINSYFGKWPSPLEGLRGYANFFHRNARYKEALKYPTDPYKFIEEIKKAGYATGPNYVAKLHGQLKTDQSYLV